jgi:23S rRNA pseudouridine2605 synthase
VKRLCESVGLQVQRLFRPEFGGVSVEGLHPGRYRELGPEEVATLRRAVGIGADGAPAAKAAPSPADALPRAARRHGHGPPAPPGGAAREGTPARVAAKPKPKPAAGHAPPRGGSEAPRHGRREADGQGRRPGGQRRPGPGARGARRPPGKGQRGR